MLKSTFYLLMALWILAITEIGYDTMSVHKREVDALIAELSEAQDGWQKDRELYQEQLLEIVSLVYNKESRIGGYSTATGVELTEIYGTIINEVRDYEDLLENTANYFHVRAKYIEGVPSVWPVDYSTAIYVTSGFGTRYDPITGHFSFHPALDIAGPRGTKILATADGKVMLHYPPPNGYYKGEANLGGYIELAHANGYATHYAHMSKTFVHEGETVKRGQVIGIIGSTGKSTGLHVHYEVLLNDEYKDPADFLQL